MLPFESIEFMTHNKLLIKKAEEFHSECWKDRCNVLHSHEIRKQHLSRVKRSIIKSYEWNNIELQ